MTTEEEKIPPTFMSQSFHCPYCGVLTTQRWQKWKQTTVNNLMLNSKRILATVECYNCENHSIWRGGIMIYPLASLAPKPVINMPDDVKEIYEEARQVHVHSARAAVALLRVALEKLTVHLGETTGKLNTRIGNLQKQGLPPQVISSFDIVRIVGNEGGAHVGTIDLTGADGADVVNKLFWLINYIIEKTINEPAEIERIAQTLPQDKLDGIENRDKT